MEENLDKKKFLTSSNDMDLSILPTKSYLENKNIIFTYSEFRYFIFVIFFL